MSLDNAQLTTLGTHIRANEDLSAEVAAGNLNAIRDYYNAETAGPDLFWVFKTSVSTDEAREALDWSEVLDETDGLTERQRWGFDTLLNNGDFDPTQVQTRDGFVAIFPGADFANTRAAILAISTRPASVVESLYAVAATGPAGGDGSSQTNCAALVFEGSISVNDVDAALELVPEE